MSYELIWLVHTILLTSVMWIPYIIDRIAVRGMLPAMGYPAGTPAPQSPWAQRAMKAHANAVENLVLFAPLVLALHVMGVSTTLTRGAVLVYFVARLAHYLLFVFAVPVARTLAFAVGWVATIALLLVLLGLI